MAKKHKKKVQSKRARKDLEAVWIALLECFASVDDVMTETGAFDPENIHKSLGRIYRQWLNSREALDSDFDRAKYRHDMKGRTKVATAQTPLGRERPASDRQKSSTARKLTSEKNPKSSAKPEKPPHKTSARRATSAKPASGGASRSKSRSGYGGESPSAKGKGSGSGLSPKASPKSRKGTR